MTRAGASLCASLSLCVVAQAQIAAEFPARTRTVADGVSIEADPADAAYVRALIARLQQPDPPRSAEHGYLTLAGLRDQRGAVLQELATR